MADGLVAQETTEGSEGAQPGWAASKQAILKRWPPRDAAGTPLYLQLQGLLSSLIAEGRLPPGTQIPPDQHLAAVLGISLGTVQKALGQLAAIGMVSRERGRGRGTSVTGPRRALPGLWHFRFVDPETGGWLPVYSELIGRRRVHGDADVRSALCDEADGYIEIQRVINVDGRFRCHSRFYLPARRFAGIMALPDEAVEGVNLKATLAEAFDAPTLTTRERIRLATPDAQAAHLIGIRPGDVTTRLDVLATTLGDALLSYQVIHVPPTDCPLDVSPIRTGWNNPQQETPA